MHALERGDFFIIDKPERNLGKYKSHPSSARALVQGMNQEIQQESKQRTEKGIDHVFISHSTMTKDEQATRNFSEKASAFFAPQPQLPETIAAFKQIIAHLDSQSSLRYKGRHAREHAREPRSFTYLSGKSRYWRDVGKELEKSGGLPGLHMMLGDYINFLRRINQGMYTQTRVALGKLDECWTEIRCWQPVVG